MWAIHLPNVGVGYYSLRILSIGKFFPKEVVHVNKATLKGALGL